MGKGLSLSSYVTRRSYVSHVDSYGAPPRTTGSSVVMSVGTPTRSVPPVFGCAGCGAGVLTLTLAVVGLLAAVGAGGGVGAAAGDDGAPGAQAASSDAPLRERMTESALRRVRRPGCMLMFPPSKNRARRAAKQPLL